MGSHLINSIVSTEENKSYSENFINFIKEGFKKINMSVPGKRSWRGVAEEIAHVKAWSNEDRGWRVLQGHHGWDTVAITVNGRTEAGKSDEHDYGNLAYHAKEVLYSPTPSEHFYMNFICHLLCQA